MGDSDSTYIGCPNCGVRYRWRNELASKKILCPCGCKFRMPNIAAGPPTTITLPPKGNAVTANAGLRPGVGQPSAEPTPIAASDAVGELARLHLLDDLKQKIDNDGTLNSGRFVMPSGGNADRPSERPPASRARPTGQSTPTVGEDGRLQLDLDDPAVPTEPDEPALALGASGLVSVPMDTSSSDPGATGNYDLNLDAFTPASAVISPDTSLGDVARPQPTRSDAMVVGEALSRADMKKKRKEEEEQEVIEEHLRRAYIYPLACIIFGLVLILLNILVLGPKIDHMIAAEEANETAQKARNGGSRVGQFGQLANEGPAPDSPAKPVVLDNSKSPATPEVLAMVKAPNNIKASAAHVMPSNMMAKSTNPEYERLKAMYHTQVESYGLMIARSLISVAFMFLSTVYGFIGLLLCVKLLGSGFDGLISTMLKLVAIAFVLEGSMSMVESFLLIITEGYGGPTGMVTGVVALALFWAMCAWLLEMTAVEILIMFASVFVLTKITIFSIKAYMLIALGIV
jgi:hypothetical protein